MPLHDVECSRCGAILDNFYASPWDQPVHGGCGGSLTILWHSAHPYLPAVHPSERVVVWQAPDGTISYPPRNDSPMPRRYHELGYQRMEFDHAHDVEKFEKDHGVANEKLWYNNGNGA